MLPRFLESWKDADYLQPNDEDVKLLGESIYWFLKKLLYVSYRYAFPVRIPYEDSSAKNIQSYYPQSLTLL